ncbi:MAG TPA: PAS domain S-box protein [Gallionellaceae bacterium]|nr:PAS domain S-box protein [Gallionellaceae bacterium]
MNDRRPQHPFLREVTDQLYTNNMPTVAVGIAVSILLALMLWGQAPSGVLLAGWLAAVLVAYAGRFFLAQAYFRSPTRGSRSWLTRFRAGAALQGALWGFSAFILFPGLRPVDDIAYLFAISGLAAGAAIAFGIDITSMLWFELPLASPLMARMFMLESADYVAMGLLVLLFLAYVSIVLPRSSAAIRENLRLRLQAAQREAESRERNALLDGILDNEPECVKIIALDGSLQMMNKAGLAMIEVGSVEEANASGLLNFIHPGHRAAFRRLMETVFQGVSGQLEFQVVGKRGGLRWLDTNATPLRNAAGEITGLLGVTRNVTARKRTEHDLQKSEQRYRMLSSGTFEGILLTSQGRIVDLNEQLARMLGYARDEMPGRLLSDFIAPEHRDLVARNIASGEEHSGEVDMLHQTGRRVLVEGHGQSYEQDGVTMRLTAIRDITERKEHEARLRESRQFLDSIVEHIPNMIFLKEAEHLRFAMINAAGERLLGHTRAEMLGRNDYDFFPKDQADFFTGNDRAVLAAPADSSALDISEEVIATPSGARLLHTQKLALRGEDGRPRYLLGISEDITERMHHERLLRESEEKLRGLYELAPLGIALADLGGRFVEFNEAFRAICGYPEDELKNLDYWALTPKKYQADESAQLELLRTTGRYGPYEKEYIRKDGTPVPVRLNGVLVSGRDGRQYIWSIMEDISATRRAEREVRIAATAFESQEGMMITDAQARILRVNKAFTDITGYTIDDVAGQNPSMLSSGRHDPRFFETMWAQIEAAGSWSGEVWNRRKDGEIFPEHLTITSVKDANGDVINYVGTLVDITQRKASEEEIQRLAFNDHLTGLPNRRLFMDRLQQSIAAGSRNPRVGALLFIDLDNFKNLNDSLGHDYGDMLLQQIAQRLKACVRHGDTVARLGGDEFVVLLEDVSPSLVSGVALVEGVARKVLETLGSPYNLNGVRYISTTSIGVTLIAGNHYDADTLLKQADIAMYQAKKSGRNTVRFFDRHMQDAVSRRTALENDLRGALERGEISLHYQVQVSAQRKPVGAEALVRWNHPARGMIPPAEFIPLAEESGLILALERTLIEKACDQLKAWEQHPRARQLSLAVNVSARQFHGPEFAEEVARIVSRHGINPGRLKLEVTEDIALQDIDKAVRTLSALSETGVQVALDDFGTGYSSLQFLNRLPLDQIKIDPSFVRDLGQNSGALAIVQTIIAMADSMGLDIIAEGVETAQQFDILHRSGCTHFQGYLFGMPVPAAEFEAALAAHAVTER